MASAPDDISLSLHQDTNQFLVKAGIEPRSFIQPPKTLPVELTRIHKYRVYFKVKYTRFPLSKYVSYLRVRDTFIPNLPYMLESETVLHFAMKIQF